MLASSRLASAFVPRVVARHAKSHLIAGGVGSPRLARALSSSSTATAATSVETQFERHAPIGKDGEGLYTASTKGAFDVIQEATPAVLKAIRCIPNAQKQAAQGPTATAFSVADYGTADGGTSLGLMGQIVQAVRAQCEDERREIHIQYEDQRENEWKSVFNHALGVKAVTNAYGTLLPSPRKDATSGVYISASGVGFHEQAFPSQSIDLGVSFTAMHWLSAAPNSLVGDGTAMHAAQCEDERAAAERDQAAADWLAILQARCRELRPGGRMLIANFCVSEEGYFLGHTNVGANMWDSFQSAWNRLASTDQGLIDEEERVGVSFPSYYRTTQECIDGVNQVEDLSVVSCQEKVVPCPYRQAWTGGNVEGRTAREQAEWFVPTTRTWSESTFKNALHADRTDKDAVMEQFWSNYVDLVEKDPSIHGMDYVHTYLVVEKAK